MTEIKKDTVAEKKIRGPVLFAAILWSIPDLIHKGTSTIPPPILTHPPNTPAKNPLNIPYRIF